jgi:hypothetical protein
VLQPALEPEAPAPRVESRARDSLRVQLDAKRTWAKAMQAVSDSQGKVLVAREDLGFVSFLYDLAPRLSPSSFVNANLLVRQLLAGQGPGFDLLRARLSTETRDELARHRPDSYPSDCLLNLLAEDLNRVIRGEALTPQQNPLSISSRGSDTEDGAMQNLQWIEAVLPNTIRRWSGDPRGPGRLVVCNALIIADDDGRACWVYLSSWQAGAPTPLSYGAVFFASLERALKGRGCAFES